jgi:hypothetical protein
MFLEFTLNSLNDGKVKITPLNWQQILLKLKEAFIKVIRYHLFYYDIHKDS